MKNFKLIVCIVFVLAFVGFELLHSEAVSSQTGGSALSAPTGVIASDNVYINKVSVQWDTIRDATSYRVFRNTINDPLTATSIGVTSSNIFLDNSATAGQAQFYWVRSENASSVSDLSTPDEGTRSNATQGGGIGPLNPPPPPPLGNPITATKIYLGKALFWDEQLSSTRTVACGTCHHANTGGADPRSVPLATLSFNPGPDGISGSPDDIRGSAGVPNTNPDGSYVSVANYGLNAQVTGRKTVSHINAAYSPNVLFWDGRATGEFRDPITNSVVLPNGAALESQAVGPPVSSAEMAHNGRDWNAVAARIAETKPLVLSPSVPVPLATWIGGRTYQELFLEAFGTAEVTPARIAMAIATYERALYTDRTPFDLDASGITPLSAAAQRGRGLFNGGATGCSACHAGTLFSDDAFHYIGVRPQNDDTGRFQVTGANQDIGTFRTPSLRNVELRQSFFHNGQFTTLNQVVAFYNRGGDFNGPNKDPRIRPLGLNQGQQNDLVAFLRSLTDPRLVTESTPFDRPMLYAESSRVPQVSGTGLAGSGGFVPQIKIISPPYVGNPNFTVSVSSALGGANGTLVIARVDPGTTFPRRSRLDLKRADIVTANTGAGNGWASVSLALENLPRTRATTFYARWYIVDPSVPGGYAVSPVCVFTFFKATVPGLFPSLDNETDRQIVDSASEFSILNR